MKNNIKQELSELIFCMVMTLAILSPVIFLAVVLGIVFLVRWFIK